MRRYAAFWRWLRGVPAEPGTALSHVEAVQAEQAQAEVHLDELRRRLLHVEAELVERSEWTKQVKP